MPVRYGQLSEHLKRASLLNMERDVAALPSSGPTGNSAVMRRVRKLIEKVAGFDTTVLVTGESGTGKEVVRSEERRVGKECVRTCSTRWSPAQSKKKNNIIHGEGRRNS